MSHFIEYDRIFFYIFYSFRQEGPWKKRTKLEKGLIFLVIIFLLAVIGLIIAVVLVRKDTDETKQGL